MPKNTIFGSTSDLFISWSRFILEHGLPSWYLLITWEYGTSGQRISTRGILGKRRMFGLSILRLLTKQNCLCQTMLSFVASLVNYKSMEKKNPFQLYFYLSIVETENLNDYINSNFLVCLLQYELRPQDISSATSITGDRLKMLFTLLMMISTLISALR